MKKDAFPVNTNTELNLQAHWMLMSFSLKLSDRVELRIL